MSDAHDEFERYITLTHEFTQVQWAYVRIQRLNRAGYVFNTAGAVLFVLSIFEDGLTLTYWTGATCCLVAYGILGQVIWTRKRLNRRAETILEQMRQIGQQLEASKP